MTSGINTSSGSGVNARNSGSDDDAQGQNLTEAQKAQLLGGQRRGLPENDNARGAELNEAPANDNALEEPKAPQISGLISSEVNSKVNAIYAGQTAVHKFHKENVENEQFSDFFERNREEIDRVLKIDINGKYNELKAQADVKSQIHDQLTGQKYLSVAELNQFRGIEDSQPFLDYLDTIEVDEEKRPSMIALTPEDRTSLVDARIENIQEVVDRLKGENKITDIEGAKLKRLGPKTAEQMQGDKERVEAKIKAIEISQKVSFLSQYKATQKKEAELAQEFDKYREDYNRLVEGIVKQLQEEVDSAECAGFREARVKRLEKQTGLPIREGQVLWAVDVDEETQQAGQEHNKRIEIKNISFEGEIEDNIQKISIPSFEPVITFSAISSEADGTSGPAEFSMSATNFEKWVAENQVKEKFESEAELEQELGIPNFIKPGQTFEYIDPASTGRTSEGEEEPELPTQTATIESIENGIITLDREVLLDGPVAGTTHSIPRRTSSMDFGDFARWYRKFVVVPDLESLSELDKLLAEHHTTLLKEMGWPEDHGAPIELDGGRFPQYLMSAYEPGAEPPLFMTVNGVTKDGRIETASGDFLNPNEFYRVVKEHGLTRPTKEQLKEIQQKANATKNEDLHNQLAAIAAAPTTPEDSKQTIANNKADSQNSEKGFWNRLKDFWTNTKVLSLMEIYELFLKAPAERVKEWMKDRSERRVADVGERFYDGFPTIGGLNKLKNKYEGVRKGKYATDVSDKEKEYEDNSIDDKDVLKELYEAPDLVILKACLQRLSKKGKMRLEDDPKIHAIINKLLGDFTYPEKYHDVFGPNCRVIVGDEGQLAKRKGLDTLAQCKIIFDAAWGSGTYDSLHGENERAYKEKKEKTAENMHKDYEYRGGIGNTLQQMLDEWDRGIDVNEAEFDGLLTNAIKRVEVPPAQAFLLLISAFAVRNPKTGQTLLTYSRLNAFVPELRDHQMFFYFADIIYNSTMTASQL